MTLTRRAALATALTLAATAVAYAHPQPPVATRQLVRIQGRRGDSSAKDVQRRLILVALGVEQPFAATDWQVFGFSELDRTTEPTPPAAPQRFTLQGSRDLLASFAAARPEQLVTLLAERHPGSTELFVLTLDLCPPR